MFIIKKIILLNFDFRKVKDMSCMFYGCLAQKKFNISNYNTCNDEHMNNMFEECTSLEN